MKQICKKLIAFALVTTMALQLVSGLTTTAKQVEATDTANMTTSGWDYSVNFENADVKNLTDFTSTKFDSSSSYSVVEQDKTIYDHWYTGTGNTDEYGRDTGYLDQNVSTASGNRSAGLKALTGFGKSYRYLASYTGAQYENFEVVSEIHSNLATDGIAFGEKNVFPASSDSTSARVYFTGTNTAGRLYLEGAFDYSSYKVTGTEADTTNLGFSKNLQRFTFSTDGLSRGQVLELHIKKEGTTVTIWVEGYAPVLAIELASTWVAGPVSLCTHGTASGGGFKSFAIEEITNVAPPGFFENADLSTMTNFTATQFKVNNQLVVQEVVGQDQPVSEYWFTGNNQEVYDTIGTNQAYRNKGLKPKHTNTEGLLSLLAYNGKTSDNFEMSVSYIKNFIGYGLYIGESNVVPHTVNDSAVKIHIQENAGQGAYYLYIQGAVDSNSAETSGTIIREASSVALKLDGYTITHSGPSDPNSDMVNKVETTIHVKVENGKLTASVDDYEVDVTVNLNAAYVDDAISLYSTGGNQGGFVDFEITELAPSADKATNLTYKMESMNKYAVVTLSTDTTYSKIKQVLNYDKNVYEYAGVTFGEDNFGVNADCKPVNDAENGTISIASYANLSDKVVSMYFQTKNDSIASDFRGFTLEEDCVVTLSGGKNPTDVSKTEVLDKDYHVDKCINVADIVATKKSTSDDSEALRKMLVGKYESVLPLQGKTVLSLGDSIAKGARDAYGMAWSGRLEMYGAMSENVSQSGWVLTPANLSLASRGGSIVSQLKNATKESYDFVLLEGGVNDVLELQAENTNISWGEVIDPTEGAEYNTATIAGAMQDLVAQTQKKFPQAKIIYIINSYYGATTDNMNAHRATVQQVCGAHGISYVDLSDTSILPELNPEESTLEFRQQYLPDGLHPNAASYELTTPYIVERMEELLLNSKWRARVYVGAGNGTDMGDGSKDSPYSSMAYALNNVEDGGTIEIIGECDYGTTDTFGLSYKEITVVGGTLDISKVEILQLNGPVTLGTEKEQLTVKVNSDGSVFANGNPFKVAETVSFDTILGGVYGGGRFASVTSTYLELESGTYRNIYGGGMQGQVEKDTYLYIGGNVNKGSNSYKHDNMQNCNIYGGCFKAQVNGDTNVVFDGEYAEAGRIYGAGAGADSSVQGTSNVTIKNGKVYSVYGGSSGAEGVQGTSTNVLVEGGTVAQIFGGSECADLYGNTYVHVTGGTVTRRIYGGCYGQLEENHTYHVKGNSTLRIEKVNYTRNDDAIPTEYMISACSRTETNHTDENATLEIPQDLYNSLDDYIGGTVWSWTIPDFDVKSFI